MAKIPVIVHSEVIARYRESLRNLYGNDLADKSELWYSNGWYYINVARTFPDGSTGTLGLPERLRGKQVEARATNLIDRYVKKCLGEEK